MEIDEHLKYTLYVSLSNAKTPATNFFPSLQFDPCPRAGEPMVSRRMLQVQSFYFPNSKLTKYRHTRLLPLIATLPEASKTFALAVVEKIDEVE